MAQENQQPNEGQSPQQQGQAGQSGQKTQGQQDQPGKTLPPQKEDMGKSQSQPQERPDTEKKETPRH